MTGIVTQIYSNVNSLEEDLQELVTFSRLQCGKENKSY